MNVIWNTELWYSEKGSIFEYGQKATEAETKLYDPYFADYILHPVSTLHSQKHSSDLSLS